MFRYGRKVLPSRATVQIEQSVTLGPSSSVPSPTGLGLLLRGCHCGQWERRKAPREGVRASRWHSVLLTTVFPDTLLAKHPRKAMPAYGPGEKTSSLAGPPRMQPRCRDFYYQGEGEENGCSAAVNSPHPRKNNCFCSAALSETTASLLVMLQYSPWHCWVCMKNIKEENVFS